MTTPPKAYYNENDPFAAAWLRNLIAAGLIADGEVDERSIEDVYPIDLAGYTQCHFFAGVGGWSYAARLAGWPDSRPLWTGSCPCQPFSTAGKRGGMSDERHLWPAFFHLIQNGKPRDVPVFGEQVASPDGLAWLDLVQTDLEGTGHSCWATDICAAGFGAPIIRQRLWWLACAKHAQRGAERTIESLAHRRNGPGWSGDISGLACTDNPQRRSSLARGDEFNGNQTEWIESNSEFGTGRDLERLANNNNNNNKRLERRRGVQECSSQLPAGESSLADRMAGSSHDGRRKERPDRRGLVIGDYTEGFAPGPESSGINMRTGPTNSFWRNPDWLLCRDDKWRPVEPGTQPLAHGVPNRVGRLRGFGNAINAETAAEILRAYMDCCPES